MKFAVVFLCLLLGGSAFAAPPTQPGADERPWAVGVSRERQDEAIRLFTEGTKLLKDSFLPRAVELYVQALESWDHPAIHFNLAKAYMSLDKPVEAYTHLKLAMKYNGAPLEADQVEQVNKYINELYTNELADITIVVDEPDAVVSLDGREIFRAPGRWNGVVRPERHTVIATKDGFQPAQEQAVLKRGEKRTFTLTPVAIENSVRYERKFGNWIPWTVIGAGVAILGAGGVAMWQSTEAFAEYDDKVFECTNVTAQAIRNDVIVPGATEGQDTGGRIYGCRGDDLAALKPTRDRGELMNTLGVTAFAVGGATLATGFVLLYINRERPVTVEAPVTLTPYVNPDGGGLQATINF
jgi:hypothetical protein